MKKLETRNIGTRHSLCSACSLPHGSRTPARGGYGNTSTLATIGRLLAAVVLLASAGCKSMKENGIFSPRSGELFQTTKMGTGVLASSCVFPTVLGWFYVQKGDLLGLPIAIVSSPFAIVATVLDLGVVSPLTDLACLPYDLSQPQHGFYIRIVDEEGKPIPGARISGSVENDEDMHLLSTTDLSGTTDEAGEFYVGRLFKCHGSMSVKASGYAPWLGSESIRLPKNEKCSGGQTAVTNAIPTGERIVLQYTMKRSNVGDWNQKSDLSREEVEKLCVGTWRPDEDACKFIVDELGMKTGQENPAEHWIELHSDGTAVCHAPGRYYKSSVSSVYSHELRYFQDPFAWTVEQNEASPWRPVSGNSWICMKWTWRARLFVVDEKEKYRKTARYYLGEDDKGVYLAAECEDYYTPPRCILKFRKVPGSKQPSPLRGRAHSGM